MSSSTASTAVENEGTTLQKVSWVLYDWANSGYGLIVIGPIFQDYFIKHLLPTFSDGSGTGLVVGSTRIPASAVMGTLTSVAMALMAVGAPTLGAIADIKGWTRKMLTISGVLGAALTMLMFFVTPGHWPLAATLYVLSNFCFGTSFGFANTFLPRLARPEKQGSLSGWGFALGYIGGAVALVLAGLIIAKTDMRYGLAFAGIWWFVFALPAYLFLPELPAQANEADRGGVISAGLRRTVRTLKNIRKYRMLFLFLLAFLLYNDGVETVISMSPAFGSDYLKMETNELIRMFLIVQFVAFGGAMVFGYLSDRIGNKTVIVINLIVWILAAILALWVKNAWQFTMLGVLVGLVLGGVQSASRALMGLLAPENIRAEAFGFFSISGKFASIFGPLLYSIFVTTLGTRYGILSVLPFLVFGLIILLRVVEPKKGESGQPAAE